MNYYNFVNKLLETASKHKFVKEVTEGDIYEHLNSGDHKYPCVCYTVQNIASDGQNTTVTGSLFYVDRLLSDSSNKLQIQSAGLLTLHQIFMRFQEDNAAVTINNGTYTPFDEKFADLCAGVFSNFSVSFVDDTCVYNDDIFDEQSNDYLTFEAYGEESWFAASYNWSKPDLWYQLVNKYTGKVEQNWTRYIWATETQTSTFIHVGANQCIKLKGNNPEGFATKDWNVYGMKLQKRVSSVSEYINWKVYGNIMSLMFSDNFKQDTYLTPYCFSRVFSESGGNGLIDASGLILPADELKEGCYTSMFNNSYDLIYPPELPATKLAKYCYFCMFRNNYSMKNAPILPADELKESCYARMFECNNDNPSNLEYVKCLATDVSATDCMKNFIYNNHISKGTFVKKAGVNYPEGVIPSGWTVVEE